MPSIKKINTLPYLFIEKDKAIAAMEIHAYSINKSAGKFIDTPFMESEQEKRIVRFLERYKDSHINTIQEIWKWAKYIMPEKRDYSVNEIYNNYVEMYAPHQPRKLEGDNWLFNGIIYEVKGFYSDDEKRLLILEEFDKERKRFEKLKTKFDVKETETVHDRPRIPEKIRVEVWRRDGGKCARCACREKLEYDHIVPISKGGSNTVRNIELLCEKCNRSKSNNVA